MTCLRRRQFLLAAAAASLAPLRLRSASPESAIGEGVGSIAVCLGSGALHGYAHIGAIRAFELLGLRPDAITGTSVGAIAGVLWAAGFDADQIEAVSHDRSCERRSPGPAWP